MLGCWKDSTQGSHRCGDRNSFVVHCRPRFPVLRTEEISHRMSVRPKLSMLRAHAPMFLSNEGRTRTTAGRPSTRNDAKSNPSCLDLWLLSNAILVPFPLVHCFGVREGIATR